MKSGNKLHILFEDKRVARFVLSFATLAIASTLYLIFSINQYRDRAPEFSEADNILGDPSLIQWGDSSEGIYFIAFITLSTPNWVDQSSLAVDIANVQVFYPKPNNSSGFDYDEICIEQILVGGWHGVENEVWPAGSNHLKTERNPCVNVTIENTTPATIIGHTEDVFREPLPIGSSNTFMYPFDKIRTRFVIQIQYQLNKDGTKISQGVSAPAIELVYLDAGVNNWVLKKIAPDQKFLSEEELSTLEILPFLVESIGLQPLVGSFSDITVQLNRPLNLQIAFPFIIGAVLIFIVIIPNIPDLGTFAEVSLAVFFGLFSIRQLLLPSEGQDIRTILDIALVGLYGLFSLAVLLFFFAKVSSYIKTRTESEKPNHATIVASVESDVYHQHTCQFAGLITESQKITFKDVAEAEKSGRRPCKKCLNDVTD